MMNIILINLYIDQLIDLNQMLIQQFLKNLMNHNNDQVLEYTKKVFKDHWIQFSIY